MGARNDTGLKAGKKGKGHGAERKDPGHVVERKRKIETKTRDVTEKDARTRTEEEMRMAKLMKHLEKRKMRSRTKFPSRRSHFPWKN